MDMLVRKTGWDNFRAAIIEYLKTYSYGNTDWDGLVAILDRQSPDDLEQWSRSWVKKPGMPVIDISYEKGNLAIVQSDILGENVIRDQSFGVTFFKRDKTEVVRIDLEEAQYHLNLGGEYDFFIPNSDFHGYGYFRTSTENILSALLKLPTIYDAVMKYSIIINTHEAVLNGDFDPVKYISGLIPYLRDETDELLFAEGLRTVENIVGIFLYNQSEAMRTYEEFLSQTISNGKTQAQKIYASQAYCRSAHTPAAMQDLLEIWQNEGRHTQYFLGERDLTSLSYRLAAYYPDKSKEITETQLSRISNPDRRDEYIWISRAVDPDPEVRNDFFKELLLPENRTIEPRVLTALSLLNKPENMPYALDYVIPALEELDGVQKTGDIFMPAGWCYALLGSHRTPEALDKVNVFLDRNPELNPLLRSKILINADELRRAFEYSNRVN